MNLSTLTGAKKQNKRVGRGPGSKRGKTSTRGHKGDKSRSGYKTRAGKEGGQAPLFKKMPTRGFTRGRFKRPVFALSLERINTLFEDGEVVSKETLQQKGYSLRKYTGGLKILGNGELEKKISIEADMISKSALRKLEKNNTAHAITQK